LIINVAEDSRLNEGYDIYTTATVNALPAILGGEAEVDTLDGKIINIPGTQPEQNFRLAAAHATRQESPEGRFTSA
jgi:DnaJ-class molecular chaperone